MEALLNKKSGPEEFFAGLARQEKVGALRVFWKLKMQGVSHSTFWRNRVYCGLSRGQSPASSVSPSRERRSRLRVRQDTLYGSDTHWMVTGRLCNSCRKNRPGSLIQLNFVIIEFFSAGWWKVTIQGHSVVAPGTRSGDCPPLCTIFEGSHNLVFVIF